MDGGKKIFITVSDDAIARNILRSFVLEELLKNFSGEIGLVVPSADVRRLSEEFGSLRVRVFTADATDSFFNRMLGYLCRNGFYSETILTDQGRRFLADRRVFLFLIKRILTYGVGRSRLFHRVLRWLARFRRYGRKTESLFLREKPDLLFATDVFHDFDLEVLSAARAAGVKTVGMVRSWDNITSTGLMQIVPQFLLVWSMYLYQYAMGRHYISSEKIEIVGIPHYDWYVKKEAISPRGVFLQAFGIPPEKKILLYAGIGSDLAPHEPEVAEILSKGIEEGKIHHSPIVIFRPHPAFGVDRKNIIDLPHVVFDDTVIYKGKETASGYRGRDAILHLVNSLAHADVVIATASTMILDAAAFDKPIVGVAFDGYHEEHPWRSLAACYYNHTHSRDLLETGAFEIVYRPDELISAINECLANPGARKEGREKIREEFIGKLDGQSAQRVAAFLKRMADGDAVFEKQDGPSSGSIL